VCVSVRVMRYLSASALVMCALVAQAVPQEIAQRKIPCKTPENAASCYWVRGRLAFYNGNPSYRIWKVGTNRILGIYSGPSRFPPRTRLDSEDPEFPRSINKAFRPPNNRIFADFEVCPLDRERPGWMQDACIESAKNIIVRILK
jgi:hypothetical protein